MATLPQVRMSVDEYIERFVLGGEKPAQEYVDGLLVARGMGTREHGRITMNIGYLVKTRYKAHFRASAEQHIRNRATRFRIPDVAVERRGRHDAGHYPGTEEPIHLCIEIKSPPDTLRQLFVKCHDEYLAWGVPFCWVIDPDDRRAWEFHSSDREPREVLDQLSAGEIVLPLAGVFDDID